jgi:hypothetical protein
MAVSGKSVWCGKPAFNDTVAVLSIDELHKVEKYKKRLKERWIAYT